MILDAFGMWVLTRPCVISSSHIPLTWTRYRNMVQCPVIYLCVDKSLLKHFSLLIKRLWNLVVLTFLTCTAIYWYEWRSFTRLQRAIKIDRSTGLFHTLALLTAHAPTPTCSMWTCLACFTQAWNFVYHIKEVVSHGYSILDDLWL